MNKMNKKALKKILSMLERETFAKWYREGRFDDYITGCPVGPTKEDILADLKKMLR